MNGGERIRTNVLAVIPARGGSKGVPQKNIREAGGKPLIAWTIEEARQARSIDRLVVSSDDDDILSVAARYGCEGIRRPAELAADDAPTIDAVFHALDVCGEFTHVVLLQPTSPFRTAEDIDQCVAACLNLGAPACVSVCEADKSPYWMYNIGADFRLSPLLAAENRPSRRQDLPPVYVLNGAVYAAEVPWLRTTRAFVTEETAAYVMPKERSLDIDTPLDFEIADYLLGKAKK